MWKWLTGLFRRPAPVPSLPPDVPAPPPAKTPAKTPMRPATKGAWLAICLTIVMGFEGLYTKAYRDPVNVVTICYGVTNHDRPVRMGDTYTPGECRQMLEEDLHKYLAQARKCIPGVDGFPPHRKAAIVSFTYNVGQGNLCKSSVARHLNAGRVKQGCDALLLWNKAGGKVLRGLERRRAAERALCVRDD